MSRPLSWNREGLIWPHREVSEFVDIGRAKWHVQRMGDAAKPALVLLHGTGSSVHSWRTLAPMLAQDHSVFAMDLPRHGFTSGHGPEQTSLPAMANVIARLLDTQGVKPTAIIGHSAGAALALQLALDHEYRGPIIGLGSALRPFPGPAAQIFPAIAKVLFVNPLVPRIFSGAASLPGEAERFLVRSTGSQIDQEGLACYAELLRNPRHTKGALAMMANWDLPTLRTRMKEIGNPVHLIHSDKDKAIPLEWAREANEWLPHSSLQVLDGLGHLAHEEDAGRVMALIDPILSENAVGRKVSS